MTAEEIGFLSCLKAYRPAGCGTEAVDVESTSAGMQVRCHRCARAVQLFSGLEPDRLYHDPDNDVEAVGASQMPSDLRAEIQHLLADALVADYLEGAGSPSAVRR